MLHSLSFLYGNFSRTIFQFSIHDREYMCFSCVSQTLRRYIKKPPFCPATEPAKAIVPTSNPQTVYDIKYFSRDQRRNRPPIRRTVLKKADGDYQIVKEQLGLFFWITGASGFISFPQFSVT